MEASLIFRTLCTAFYIKIIEIWTIQTRERAQLVLIKANRVINIRCLCSY